MHMFEFILSLLFPYSDFEKQVLRTKYLTPKPSKTTTTSGLKVLTCASYRNIPVRAAITTLKFHGNHKSAKLCATILSDVLTEELATSSIWDPVEKILILPIPLSKQRQRARGFNQIHRLCEMLPQELRHYVESNILLRVRHTKSQTELNKSGRLLNTFGAFSVRNPEKIYGAHIYIIDDVVTTGATLSEATRVLKNAGATKVTAVAVARA